MAGLLGTSLTTDEMWDTLKSIGRGVNLGSTSGLLGGPVDLATMLLNNPGMLHPGLLGTRGLGIENPVGGSKWIEQKLQPKGLLPKRQGNWQETAGELASAFVNPATAAAVAGPKLYAMESKIAQNAAAPTTLNKQTGAIVWHGSPHKFDKFDSSKIGTGEGAQAYGHGLYLAESPTVAKKYIPSLSNEDAAKIISDEIAKNGRGTYGLRVPPDPVNVGDVLSPSMRWIDGNMTDKPLRGVSVAAIKNNDVLSALQNLGISKRGPNGHYFGDEVALVKGSSAKVGQDFGEWTLKDAKVVGKYLKKGNSTDPILGGNLYKVDLPDEHIAKMLDWDKPISQQHPDVRSASTRLFGPNASTLTGQELYKKASSFDAMQNVASKTGGDIGRMKSVFPNASDAEIQKAIAASKNMGSQDRIAAQIFKDAGIPGIRYLDQGSRGTGTGTSNFVVFPGNEDLLKILEMNGQPMGGLLGR